MVGEQLMRMYELLFDRFGPQHWWPGETQVEIIVGAILTQNTSWANVEKAIANLKGVDCLAVDKLHSMQTETLSKLIRPAGYFRIKAKRLKSFIDWLVDAYGGQLGQLEEIETTRLREELLAVKGVGPETADSILLYAFGRCVFVVDAYTARVAVRHGLIEEGVDYEQLQELFASNLAQDVWLFNEYHALLVRVGKEYCKPQAKCQGCPLESLAHSLEPELS